MRVYEYRGTSPKRKRIPLGPYLRPMPGFLGGSQGSGGFLMGEVPLYLGTKGTQGCKGMSGTK